MNLVRKKLAALVVAAVVATIAVLAGVGPGSAGAPAAAYNDCSIGHFSIYGSPLSECEMKGFDNFTGHHRRSLSQAKFSYWQRCGKHWQYNSGHHFCDWSSRGWKCYEKL